MVDDELCVLLLEGDSGSADAVLPQLLGLCPNLTAVHSLDEALAALEACRIDLAVIRRSPGDDGLAAAAALSGRRPGLQLLMVGEPPDLETLQGAMELGVAAYLSLPLSPARMAALLERYRREAGCRNSAHCSRLVATTSDPRHAYLQIDGGGAVQLLNEAARELAPSSAADRREQPFAFFASQALADRRSFRVAALVEAASAGLAWRGELYGNGRNQRAVFDVELFPCPAGAGAGNCGVSIREVTGYARTIDRLLLQKNEALDQLRLAAPQGASGHPAESLQPVRLQSLVQSAFLAHGTLPVAFGMAAQLPEVCLAPAAQLTEICAGLALHVCSLPRVQSIAFSVAFKEQSAEGMLVGCRVQIGCAAVEATRFLSSDDYLCLLEQGALDGSPRGIGLAAARLASLGSSLAVRCTAGEGLCFSFSLKLQASAGAEPTPAAAASPSPSGTSFWSQESCPTLKPHPGPWRTLVADDNLIDQASLKALLEQAGCAVVLVGNGREALDEFDSGDFDLVLMDILMPVMDGFESTRLIRERERLSGSQTPVIALTSYTLKAVHDKCISVGMHGHISKPVRKADIAALFERLTPSEPDTGLRLFLNTETDALPVLDLAGRMQDLDGNLELYQYTAMLFDEIGAEQLATLDRALAARLASDTEHAAHKLKGSVSSLGGERLVATLKELEELAQRGAVDDDAAWRQRVAAEFDELRAALADIRWDELVEGPAG